MQMCFSTTSNRIGGLATLARLAYIVPAAIVYLLVYIARWIQRRYAATRAESWPTVDATVNSSYELDENQNALFFNGWSVDENDDEEYFPRWTIAIQYSFQADGELYAGTYFLPALIQMATLPAKRKMPGPAGRLLCATIPPSRHSHGSLNRMALQANPTSPGCSLTVRM